MRTKLLTAAALLVLAGPARLGALELSLEENKALRGNIGFVDTQRVFRAFPETVKAKENFEEAVRQAEEQVNSRKAGLLRLRSELDALKVQRAAAAQPAPVPAPTAQAVNVSSPTLAVAVATPAPAALTPAPAATVALDEEIARKTAELARQESSAREEQAAAEKNLLDLESRRSEILLGKIYRAVQEVAQREGISVVVDKSGIIYGHSAVDLTDKVLKYLRGG